MHVCPLLFNYLVVIREMFRVLVVVLFALIAVSFAQVPERTEEQQAMEMAMLEELMNRATPTCRASLETAMQSGTDVSEECKLEFQEISMEMRREFEGGRKSSGKEAPKPESWIHPAIVVAIFVGAAFAAVAGYVVHVNSQLAERERGKSRKQKVETKRK